VGTHNSYATLGGWAEGAEEEDYAREAEAAALDGRHAQGFGGAGSDETQEQTKMAPHPATDWGDQAGANARRVCCRWRRGCREAPLAVAACAVTAAGTVARPAAAATGMGADAAAGRAAPKQAQQTPRQPAQQSRQHSAAAASAVGAGAVTAASDDGHDDDDAMSVDSVYDKWPETARRDEWTNASRDINAPSGRPGYFYFVRPLLDVWLRPPGPRLGGYSGASHRAPSTAIFTGYGVDTPSYAAGTSLPAIPLFCGMQQRTTQSTTGYLLSLPRETKS
jgi:hypothetical protein